MPGAAKPAGEAKRLAELRRLGVLDTSPEEAFDRLTRLASRLLDTPIALVSLVDEHRQWFKSRVGLDATETPREAAFCGYAIHGTEPLVVRDAATDERFSDNPLVLGDPKIRFYAGAPLVTPAGALGTLCVIDRKPRELGEMERQVLTDLAGAVVDALQLRKAAAQAHRRLELLNIAEELAELGHWRISLQSQDLYWSPQIFRIHGLDPDTHVPDLATAIDAYHPDDREVVSAHVEHAIAERSDFDFELRLIRADGQLRHVHSVGQAEVDEESGEVLGVFGVFQDITDRRQLQTRLAQAEKMASVGTLAAGVAHEINNPLSYIQANAQTLSEEIQLWAGSSPSARLRELEAMVKDIQDGTRRIHKIVQGLKTFSRDSETRVEEVELPRVIEMAARLCMNELRHKAKFTLDVVPNTPPVRADESQIVQVAVNLIVNASHAIPGGNVSANEVRVSVGQVDGDHAFFEVADTGEGMSEEVMKQAFSPFFTTKPQGIGTGLGLAICHGIVTSFGGRLDAHSVPGEGTTMRVVLPVAIPDDVPMATQAAKVALDPTEAPSRRGRVLIVDDDRTVARSLARLLRGHEVEIEIEAPAALKRIDNGERWDAILCDLMMPSMSGPAFHAELAARHADLAAKMVVVTGGAFSADTREFLESSRAPVVEKPVDAEQLRAVVRSLVDAGA